MWLKRRVLPDLMLYVSFVFLVRFWKPWPGMTSSWYRPAADWAPAQSSSLRTCRSSSAPCVERDWSTSIGESPITGRWANTCCLNAESYHGRKNWRPRCTMLLTTVVCWCCWFEKLFFCLAFGGLLLRKLDTYHFYLGLRTGSRPALSFLTPAGLDWWNMQVHRHQGKRACVKCHF